MALYFIGKNSKKYKLSRSRNFFDWVCFLNNISSCYSVKKKYKKKVYFLQKDLKKIEKNKLLEKIFVINNWKKFLKNFKIKNKPNKLASILKFSPFCEFDVILKDKFVFLSDVFTEARDLFSFILIISKKYTKAHEVSTLNFMKNKKIFLLNLFTTLKNIFVTNYTVQLEYEILKKKIQLYFPNKLNLYLKKNFYKILSEYYIYLFDFIFKKISIFCDFRFTHHYSICKLRSYKLRSFFIKKDYIFRKNNFKLIRKKFIRYKKNYYKAVKLNEMIPEIKLYFWVFSKNIALSHFDSFFFNPVLYLSYEKKFSMLEHFNCKVSVHKNNEKITHVSNWDKLSLCCSLFDFSWLYSILNSHSLLPLLLHQSKNFIKININPFLSFYKISKISQFRYLYSKIKIHATELFGILRSIWVFSSIFLKPNIEQRCEYEKKYLILLSYKKFITTR